MKVMRLSFLVGDNIDNASRTASRFARKHNCRARFDFNGVLLCATPKKSPVTIGWEYRQQAERCRLSSAGQEERARSEAEVKSAQTAIDQWMLILPDILRSGLDNTIGWLSNFLPSADRVGTQVNLPMLISLFEGAGYKADECVGQDKSFYEVRENLGRYIVGQVLSMWKSVGAVHPRICDFCEEYETMRRNEMN